MEFKPLFINEDGRQQAGPTFSIAAPQDGEVLKFVGGKWINSPVQAEPNIILLNIPCSPAVEEGHVVRMQAGTAVLAAADSIANSNAIGIVESKPGATLCNIRVSGVSGELFVGLDESKEYFLSADSPGEITPTAPSDVGSVVLKMGQPFSSSRFFVNKGTRITRG